MTDPELITLIISRTREGAEALYDGYARVLMLAIIRILPQKEKAEEALEQTFVTIWREIDRFEPERTRFLRFAMRIARQRATIIAMK